MITTEDKLAVSQEISEMEARVERAKQYLKDGDLVQLAACFRNIARFAAENADDVQVIKNKTA